MNQRAQDLSSRVQKLTEQATQLLAAAHELSLLIPEELSEEESSEDDGCGVPIYKLKIGDKCLYGGMLWKIVESEKSNGSWGTDFTLLSVCRVAESSMASTEHSEDMSPNGATSASIWKWLNDGFLKSLEDCGANLQDLQRVVPRESLYLYNRKPASIKAAYKVILPSYRWMVNNIKVISEVDMGSTWLGTSMTDVDRYMNLESTYVAYSSAQGFSLSTGDVVKEIRPVITVKGTTIVELM